MAHRWLKYSYAAQKDQRHRIRWWVLFVAAFFLLYIFLSTFFFSTGVLENETMQPGLRKGDRYIFLSYFIYHFLPDTAAIGSLNRGNIVLLDMGRGQKRPLVSGILDVLIRFFTAQRIGLVGLENQFIKRVIALPGDEISMTNFVIRVRPAGGDYSFTEFEFADRPYDVTIPQVPALWDESLPFSGYMDKIVLGEGECFVLSDNRNNTNDSRTWGAVPIDYITGKVLFRYWPVTRLGLP